MLEISTWENNTRKNKYIFYNYHTSDLNLWKEAFFLSLRCFSILCCKLCEIFVQTVTSAWVAQSLKCELQGVQKILSSSSPKTQPTTKIWFQSYETLLYYLSLMLLS
jgi:hypothetical protein